MARRRPKRRLPQERPGGAQSVPSGSNGIASSGFFGAGGLVGNADPQAFQKNLQLDGTESMLANSAVYSAFTLIADDISKLRIKLVERKDVNSIWAEVENPAFSPVLRKPNHYQTRIQFLANWVTSKLSCGNTVILKERDDRQVVKKLHILDWRLITPLVTEFGDVYYQLGGDWLAGLAETGEQPIVPASEIIHDRAVCLFHPLVGVGPLYAAARSATQGNRIQANSSKFFSNASRPSGMLTAPGIIKPETALRLKTVFEENFSGANIGRLFVAGDGLEYKGMSIPAEQSQLIEQLRWTGEDIARCLHVPAYKLGLGPAPTFNNIAQLNQDYYSQALQVLIESIELLLDEGLGMTGGPQQMGTELDLDGLLRMDPESLARTNEIEMRAGYRSPDEARHRVNLAPVKGGHTPYMQQQNWPLAQLADRPAPGGTPPVPPAAPAAADPATAPAAADPEAINEGTKQFAAYLMRRFTLAGAAPHAP